MHIIGCHLAVAVQIGIGFIGNQSRAIGHMVQQQLRVSPVHIAVSIEIVICNFTGILHDRLAVHGKFYSGIHGSGQGAEIAEVTSANLRSLGKHIGGKLIGALRVRQVM